jgi:Haem-NO-binding
MKGVIFVLFEEFVTENWGAETFEALLDDCPHLAKEPIVAPRTYPDTWVVDLLMAACRRLGVTPADALRAFGQFCFGGLVSRYPGFLQGVGDAKSLLMSVHQIIHVEVKKLMEGAVPPNLFYEDLGPEDLVVHYESKRGLCTLMEGLLNGLGAHFGTPIEHAQTACTHRGDARCTFRIRIPLLVGKP